MKRSLRLSDQLINVLVDMPETGMGYHIVNVFLSNGEILRERIILNSSYLELDHDEKIQLSDICKIELIK